MCPFLAPAPAVPLFSRAEPKDWGSSTSIIVGTARKSHTACSGMIKRRISSCSRSYHFFDSFLGILFPPDVKNNHTYTPAGTVMGPLYQLRDVVAD